MQTEVGTDSRHQILRAAATLFQRNGYDATSIQDICSELGLSKGALYHHFRSKDEILFEIMSHAMQITEDRVIAPVRAMTAAPDASASMVPGVVASIAASAVSSFSSEDARGLAEARLRALIRLHLETVLRTRDREITVMLHENHPLSPEFRGKINERKKNYVKFVEESFAAAQTERAASHVGKNGASSGKSAGKSGTPSHSEVKVSARAATFALLGMINWIYQWYKPDGPISEEELIREYTEMVFSGAFGR